MSLFTQFSRCRSWEWREINASTSPYICAYAGGRLYFNIQLLPPDPRITGGRSVDVVSRMQAWTIERAGCHFRHGQEVLGHLVPEVSISVVGPTQPPIRKIYREVSFSLNWRRHEAGHDFHLLLTLAVHEAMPPNCHTRSYYSVLLTTGTTLHLYLPTFYF